MEQPEQTAEQQSEADRRNFVQRSTLDRLGVKPPYYFENIVKRLVDRIEGLEAVVSDLRDRQRSLDAAPLVEGRKVAAFPPAAEEAKRTAEFTCGYCGTVYQDDVRSRSDYCWKCFNRLCDRRDLLGKRFKASYPDLKMVMARIVRHVPALLVLDMGDVEKRAADWIGSQDDFELCTWGVEKNLAAIREAFPWNGDDDGTESSMEDPG